MNRHSLRPAFTLIEILVVIVILGITAGLIIPQLSNANDVTAAAAGRVVLADLTYAQNAAITTQRTHYIAFAKGTDADTYVLVDRVSPSQRVLMHPVTQMPFKQTFGKGGNGSLNRVRLGTLTLGADTATSTIAFDALGSPYAYTTAAGLVPLTASGMVDLVCNEFTLRVSVAPFTGEMSVAPVSP
ncbi:MAG TPA: prepilin-type N-terminal cleavage/methylation domain-containing protein [Tepidisphaeraceae bacterium]|jgi:prepilin-type N-terminal cleavage/methylation domain-containing protein|nr:prepilin-type N-terminal cleavage/methylation domain-containing protein [Tepidisphaeraceae bacterium]